MVRKYSQSIDRESAYEILSRKVTEMEKQASDEAARKEWENYLLTFTLSTRYGESPRQKTILFFCL